MILRWGFCVPENLVATEVIIRLMSEIVIKICLKITKYSPLEDYRFVLRHLWSRCNCHRCMSCLSFKGFSTWWRSRAMQLSAMYVLSVIQRLLNLMTITSHATVSDVCLVFHSKASQPDDDHEPCNCQRCMSCLSFKGFSTWWRSRAMQLSAMYVLFFIQRLLNLMTITSHATVSDVCLVCHSKASQPDDDHEPCNCHRCMSCLSFKGFSTWWRSRAMQLSAMYVLSFIQRLLNLMTITSHATVSDVCLVFHSKASQPDDDHEPCNCQRCISCLSFKGFSTWWRSRAMQLSSMYVLSFIQRLLNLMTITSHDTYIKLIVSSLDYCRDCMSRLILSKGLTATSEVSFICQYAVLLYVIYSHSLVSSPFSSFPWHIVS